MPRNWCNGSANWAAGSSIWRHSQIVRPASNGNGDSFNGIAVSSVKHSTLNSQPSTNTMSHFTTIKTQIKDIEALRSACKEMGLPLLPNAEARGYYQNKTKGDYVIQLKGPYDIALNKQPDGTYGLEADLWQGQVEQEVGQGYGKLLQLYGIHKTIRELRKQGHSARRIQQKDGFIKLAYQA
jgi:hypothetical protein